jgi:hypothetical protein
MKAYIFIPFRLPGLNDYIDAERGNRYAAASLKKNVEMKLRLYIRQQCKHQFTNPVTITYTWHELNRRRDKSNIAFAKKFIEDALVKSGVLQGDGWRHIESFSDRFKVDKLNPGVGITIEEV